MIWIAPIVAIGFFVWMWLSGYKRWDGTHVAVFSVLALALTGAIMAFSTHMQTADTEVWSGRVIDWEHIDDYDEWIPPVYDSDGKLVSAGYYEHHDAVYSIKTSDEGWIEVYESPDGKRFNDYFPNSVEPLKQYWKEGAPSASTHTYTNKVQASNSIFKSNDIDLDLYPDLPEYPTRVYNYIQIDRLLGKVPNKIDSLKALNDWNSELNKMIEDPETGKKKSWKQVNMIFVNVGANKPYEYGLALQDLWENGNKNDFVVAFSMNKDGKVNWCYPFTWSEVDLLKLEVKDYMESQGVIKDFKPVVDKVASLVAEKFERKEFADFNYIQIELGAGAIWAIVLVNVLLVLLAFKLEE